MIIGHDALTVAIEALSWIELEGFKPSYALARTVRQLDIREEGVIASAHSLIEETFKRMNMIEAMLATVIPSAILLKTKVGVRSFLKIYAYTTRLSPQGTEHGVDLVKAGREILGWRTLHSVEAFLGRLLTLEPTNLYSGLAEVEKVALETWQPNWFVRYCYRLLGRRGALKLLWKYAEGIPTYIHLNTLKGSEAAIIDRLRREKIELESDPELKDLYLAYPAPNATRLLWRTAAYREGLFHFEDKGSYLAVLASGAEAGMTVLDLSADGVAKTVHLAQLLNNKGRILSAEISPTRRETRGREIRRFGVTIAEPTAFDYRKPLPTPIEADIVMVDPPSSRTGLFGTDPSAKWRVNPEDVKSYTALQARVLEEGSSHVKIGGTLIYTTPSITLEENEMMIEHFLSFAPGFKLEKVDGVGRPALRGLHGCARIYPHLHNSNGRFVAKTRRTD